MTTEDQSGETSNLHYVADVDFFDKSGDRILIEIKEREIAVIFSNGEFYAVLNFCTHQGAPVCEGTLTGTLSESLDGEFEWCCEDEILTCPWHAWEFDIKSGRHITRSEYAIPTFETHVQDGSVYVSL
ncbi:Rieske (2Fe-2S) protein [Natrialbaceae archaeon A-CW1-1]